LKNRNYIIIGSSGGIGSQLCTDLTNCKSNLLLGYHENMPSEEFSDLKSMHVDATSFDSVMKLIQYGIEIFGNIDGVVSLPGSIILKPPHFIKESDFDEAININLKSAFGVLRAAGKALSDSSIVMMSTAVTQIGLSNHEMIVATKAGIESMVKSASVTYARKGLRFNAIAPGLVDTPLSTRIVSNPAALEMSKKMHIRDRIGSANDISNMIQFLLNPENDWITGQTFRVDGGLSSTKV
tara:strand:- start:128 stop:844 length:717 start_codon:yes stop_codon:yes gene_type:complete